MSNFRDQLKSVGKGSAQASAKQDIDLISGIVRRKMSEAGLQSYCKFTVKRRINRDGTYTIWLSFDTKGEKSPSFYNGFRGIKSVILPRLLNTGFHTKNDIYGLWRGRRVHGLRERVGKHFLEEAVEEFNRSRNGNSVATYIARDAYFERDDS